MPSTAKMLEFNVKKQIKKDAMLRYGCAWRSGETKENL